MPGSAAGTRYWVAVASQHPAPAFNGTGTAFMITFEAKNQTGTTDLDFTHIELSDDLANPISHTSSNCTVEICGPSDVAVVNVTSSKTVVGKGYSSTFNVTLENQGTKTETSNSTLCANNTVIQTKETTLESNSSEILTFYWNTSEFSKGNYTISAHISPVLGETNVVDNNFTDGWIIVAMIGDITGPDGWPDGKCDMRDIGLTARHFGQTVPPAPANCDLTGPGGAPDGQVDMRDIGLAARHFGEIDP
jgi:hypothetical protein